MSNEKLALIYLERIILNLIFVAVILVFHTSAIPLLVGSTAVLAFKLYQLLTQD